MKFFITFLLTYLLLWANPAKAEAIYFDCNRHSFQKIRQYIYKQEANSFKAFQDASIYPNGREYDYCLATRDINKDGHKDIFRFYNFGSVFCGSNGCDVDAFAVQSNGKWEKILAVQTVSNGIKPLPIYKNGYMVLEILLRVNCSDEPSKCKNAAYPSGTITGNDFYPVRFVYNLTRNQYEADEAAERNK